MTFDSKPDIGSHARRAALVFDAPALVLALHRETIAAEVQPVGHVRDRKAADDGDDGEPNRDGEVGDARDDIGAAREQRRLGRVVMPK